MSVTVLGISGYYHDAAAAIVRDGEVLAAAQEERFTRKKHDPGFPAQAINYCLEEAFLDPAELDAVVFYDDPLRTWDRVFQNSLTAGEEGQALFMRAAKSILGSKIWVQEKVRETLGSLGKAGRLLVTEHHMSHAASAFYPSPFDHAAIITLDGVGEWATTTIGEGRGADIELFREIDYPHSLGLLYSAFTYYCGFKVNSGEYKLMGLAPYGEPRYVREIYDHLIDVKPDGSFRVDTDYFGYLKDQVMTGDRFHALFGGPPRKPESRISRREMDLAASIQQVTEEVVLKMAAFARAQTGATRLVLAGGVALNCVANGKLLREGIFEDLWVQPAAGDAGGALGAALLASHRYFDVPRLPASGRDRQRGSYLGPAFSREEVRAFLDRFGYPYQAIEDDAERARYVAEVIAQGKVVGLLNGRMEYGPRALGARSILGDPRRADTQAQMNLKIKYRESFRPFAPAVLRERVADYFELDAESPYMLLVAPVREERCLTTEWDGFRSGGDDMLTVINQARSDIPAVTHVDYSARIQTVEEETNPFFYGLLKSFEAATGCAVLVNTSFNVRGEPIVCSPDDAYRCFMRTEMDLLVLEDCVLLKQEQPAFEDQEDWKSVFELD